MNVEQVNQALLAGNIGVPGLFPRLEGLAESAAVFELSFGLHALPTEPGVVLARGARQFGKSTWLEGQMRETIATFGPGSALFIDGDHLRDADHLADELTRLAGAFPAAAAVRRIFVDEITAVSNWESGMKRVLDRGELRRVLVVTTGSRAADLRHGAERLPGRKGKLARSNYLFLPVPYREFLRGGGSALGREALSAYILTGGSPAACSELIAHGRLPEWTIETTRDWILGECSRANRARRSLVAVMEKLHENGASPLGQTKLARDAGLANNTVAAGWIDMLSDLLCVGTQAAWDANKRTEIARRPAKFPFVNLLAAAVWSPEALRAPADFHALPHARQGVWQEWLVAQELFRRAAIRGESEPERMFYWQGKDHELDFVLENGTFVEVKRGQANALEYAWFAKTFANGHLTLVCSTPFETDHISGITLETFLSQADDA